MTISVDIFHTLDIPRQVVLYYWQRLYDNDLLRYRLCDVENPTMQDVIKMVQLPGQAMFYVYDNESRDILAEFTLNGFTGKAAQVHFSVNPANTPQRSMYLARTVTDDILHRWTEKGNDTPYLHSLYGLTPTLNRAACAFVQRVGFKKMGVMPMGQRYEGRPCDALVTMKTRRPDDGRS